MKRHILIATALLAGLSGGAFADGRKPGSALVYPVQRSGALKTATSFVSPPYFTVVSVTNTNLVPKSGATNIHIEYVNAAQSTDPFKPLHCSVVDRIEHLTPADTRSFLTACQNPGAFNEGYLVITALDPKGFLVPWSHDYLIGSELIVNGMGIIYELNAIPFDSPQPTGSPTDVDNDGQLDFDGFEYEAIPDELYIDVFEPLMSPALSLINLTGGTAFDASVSFSVWNDNEFPLSSTLTFRCWFDTRLTDISLVFSESFLANNTPDDPSEIDTDCDGVGDIESGWARIRGLVASSTAESIQNPALLGAVTAPKMPMFQMGGGRLLWESAALQGNGDFLKFGVDDPEQ